mmetsp:Transcript_27716/g.67212  ORF Transcript_27716/g.67212 Transcript_27716/m.67212 type:complete len:509 (+) Transcript_27716:178-1704(+)
MPPSPMRQSLLDEDSTPPFSLLNEWNFFLRQGVPLALSAVLESGIPPVFNMIVAGQTNDSATLQAALGFGRVFYNCGALMPMMGFCSGYFGAVIPGCIGAGKKERIPMYFRRSLLLTTACILPFLALQLAAAPVLGAVRVPPDVAAAAGVYCRLMILTSLLLLLETHLKIVFVSLGYAHAATLNSILTGVGVDMAATYLFVYHLDLGIRGTAYAQIALRAARVVVWLAFAVRYRMLRLIFARGASEEPLLTRREAKVYFGLAVPQILQFLGGWFIFELQMVFLSNVRGIQPAQLSAGSIWVQCEGAMAAVQSGWIQATKIRTLSLLGKQDPNAGRSFYLLVFFSFLLVTLSCAPLLALPQQIASIFTNDAAVQQAFRGVLWLLVPHALSRILSLPFATILIPMGAKCFAIVTTFATFYGVATPIAMVVALTDVFTRSVEVKMGFCLGATTIAQLAALLAVIVYMLLRIDWKVAGQVIANRANSDVRSLPVNSTREPVEPAPPCIEPPE